MGRERVCPGGRGARTLRAPRAVILTAVRACGALVWRGWARGGSGSGGGEEAEACADGHACGGDAAAGVTRLASVAVADVVGLAPCEDEEDEASEGGGDPEEGTVFADGADGFAETFGEGGWEFWRHGGQATMSVMTLPPSTISMGRAPGAMSSLSELMPSWW